MAQQRRGKTQARRSGGNGAGGLPGWAWLVIGIALTLLVVLAAPKLFKGGDGGFFRPTPNPDAQPQPVDEEAVVDAETEAQEARVATDAADAGEKATEYDFYRLLPGKEVPVSDAELAASERAERERAQKDAEATPPVADARDTVAPAAPVPVPVPETATAPAAPAPAASTETAPADDGARYLLQAGAFEASGQAEELKARIAMLGVGARVESANIRGKTVYRVRMGPYGTATELAEAKRKLAAGGLAAIAIRVN